MYVLYVMYVCIVCYVCMYVCMCGHGLRRASLCVEKVVSFLVSRHSNSCRLRQVMASSLMLPSPWPSSSSSSSSFAFCSSFLFSSLLCPMKASAIAPNYPPLQPKLPLKLDLAPRASLSQDDYSNGSYLQNIPAITSTSITMPLLDGSSMPSSSSSDPSDFASLSCRLIDKSHKKSVCLFYCSETEELARRIAAESDTIELKSINWG